MKPLRFPRPLLFQPTPRFVSEANGATYADCRVCNGFNPRPASSARRTGDTRVVAVVEDVSTHAPLRQRGEHDEEAFVVGIREFQPTPRFVSEANHVSMVDLRKLAVSTHAPLRQRGELQTRSGRRRKTVSTHAPLRQRGERAAFFARSAVTSVSTHAPLRQRGEHPNPVRQTPQNQFQPTPRFVSEANTSMMIAWD